MVREKEITEFLFSALSKSYAAEGVDETNPFPKLRLIKTESEDWRYVDQFVGGEPFQGFEIVWFKNVPIWSMTYRGLYVGKELYKVFLKFLKATLRAAPKEMPVRGPKKFQSKDFSGWTYENNWRGKMGEFKGKELIFFEGKQVYWAEYQGGLIGE